MSTRGVAKIGSRYFYLRYDAHTANEYFSMAMKMNPKSIDEFVHLVNKVYGFKDEMTEMSKAEATEFMERGMCEAVWEIDFQGKKARRMKSSLTPDVVKKHIARYGDKKPLPRDKWR